MFTSQLLDHHVIDPLVFNQEGVDGLQLDWKCPNGRRPRTPASESGEEESDDEELADIDRLHMRFDCNRKKVLVPKSRPSKVENGSSSAVAQSVERPIEVPIWCNSTD